VIQTDQTQILDLSGYDDCASCVPSAFTRGYKQPSNASLRGLHATTICIETTGHEAFVALLIPDGSNLVFMLKGSP